MKQYKVGRYFFLAAIGFIIFCVGLAPSGDLFILYLCQCLLLQQIQQGNVNLGACKKIKKRKVMTN
jgi:hypothetical protein